MVKIISIQRIAGRGVVQFVRNGTATALRFDARLSDDEVRKLVEPAVISEIDQLRLRARELNIKGGIDRMKLATLQKKIAEAEAAEAENA